MGKKEDNLREPWTAEEARENQKKSAVSRKNNDRAIADLLEEAGYPDVEKAPRSLRELAKNAVRGSAADMRLWLQQSGQLKKPLGSEWDREGICPLCGADPSGGLVIHAETIEQLARAKLLLKELLEDDDG